MIGVSSHYRFFVGKGISMSAIEKTGYGFTFPVDLTYTNDLGKPMNATNLQLAVPKEFIDSYLSYPVVGNNAHVPMD